MIFAVFCSARQVHLDGFPGSASRCRFLPCLVRTYCSVCQPLTVAPETAAVVTGGFCSEQAPVAHRSRGRRDRDP